MLETGPVVEPVRATSRSTSSPGCRMEAICSASASGRVWPIDVGTLFELKRKVEAVPHGAWKESPRYALFSSGGFTWRLTELAAGERVILVGPSELFRGLPVREDLGENR